MRTRRLIRSHHQHGAILHLAAHKKYILWGVIVWALCSTEVPNNAHAFKVRDSDIPSTVREKDVHKAIASDGASGFRIQLDHKFLVPADHTEEVWEFVCSFLGNDSESLKSLGGSLTSHLSEQLFTDTYFDTPMLQIAAMKGGVRHCRTVELMESNNAHRGRELMQITATNGRYGEVQQLNVVFDIDYTTSINSSDDSHPLLGLINRAQRPEFQDQLKSVGIDSGDMRPILSISNLRRQVTLRMNDQPVLFVALDSTSTGALWARSQFYELQAGINHALLHQFDALTREKMQHAQAQILVALTARFPYMKRDLDSKYCKALNALERQIPGYRFLIRFGLDNADGMFFTAAATIGTLIGSFLSIQRILRQPQIKCSVQSLCRGSSDLKTPYFSSS